jgi:nicotinamidase-related amidase
LLKLSSDVDECKPLTGGGEARGRVLIRGEPGNALIDELADAPGEKVILKPGKGAFCGTDLEPHLRALGRVYLIFCNRQT